MREKKWPLPSGVVGEQDQWYALASQLRPSKTDCLSRRRPGGFLLCSLLKQRHSSFIFLYRFGVFFLFVCFLGVHIFEHLFSGQWCCLWEVIDHTRGVAMLEDVQHQQQALSVYNSAPPTHLQSLPLHLQSPPHTLVFPSPYTCSLFSQFPAYGWRCDLTVSCSGQWLPCHLLPL